jgi:hypothetical protein
MDLKDTAKQIRHILLLQEGGFTMPIILTSIDRYGSVMLAEYTTVHGKRDQWDCEIMAERMKSELFEPPINMLFVDARGEAWSPGLGAGLNITRGSASQSCDWVYVIDVIGGRAIRREQ